MIRGRCFFIVGSPVGSPLAATSCARSAQAPTLHESAPFLRVSRSLRSDRDPLLRGVAPAPRSLGEGGRSDGVCSCSHLPLKYPAYPPPDLLRLQQRHRNNQ